MARKIDSKLVTKAIWNNNYWLRPPYTADKIFIHHMVAQYWSATRCGEYFKGAGVSSNYGIGYTGDIVQYVEEKYGAYAQGSQKWNKRGISIELANSTGNPDWKVSDETMDSVIELTADILKRRNLGRARYTGDLNGNICMHKWVANTGCPGPYMSKKFKHIEREVNKLLDGEVRVHERGYYKKGDRGRGVRNLQRFLKSQKCYTGPSDGDIGRYGNGTFKAVKRFQKKYHLKVDGLWGSECEKKYKELKGDK